VKHHLHRRLEQAETLLERILGEVSQADRDLARALLAAKTKPEVQGILYLFRGRTLRDLAASPHRRRRWVESFDPGNAALLQWGHAAWAYRAALLAFHSRDIDVQSGPQAVLEHLRSFEEDERWMWPFEWPAPWEAPEDEDEDEAS
jgi:hypothetical protein